MSGYGRFRYSSFCPERRTPTSSLTSWPVLVRPNGNMYEKVRSAVGAAIVQVVVFTPARPVQNALSPPDVQEKVVPLCSYVPVSFFLNLLLPLICCSDVILTSPRLASARATWAGIFALGMA
jgi:hypothetical protein